MIDFKKIAVISILTTTLGIGAIFARTLGPEPSRSEETISHITSKTHSFKIPYTSDPSKLEEALRVVTLRAEIERKRLEALRTKAKADEMEAEQEENVIPSSTPPLAMQKGEILVFGHPLNKLRETIKEGTTRVLQRLRLVKS